ncbi:hypothetical protein [Bacillus sp. FJAT-44742]|uniref:hypothetical protein n=1 Tax=Bacillus sp. FJAT-44742 TaxID=2014005 RepID=UPI000C24456C|nr:hypothetical protein [Bacillus sp. FJAT-44742]
MIVHDLVETKEYFTEETKADYYVVYEKFENSDASFEKSGRFSVKEADTEEVVQIFYGCKDNSLCSLEKYKVDEYPSVEAILKQVKNDHQEIFA